MIRMKKPLFYKITFFILILLVLIIIIFSFVYYRYFVYVKTHLKENAFSYLLHEVENLTENIQKYTQNEYGDIRITLKKNPRLRKKYNSYLRSFITSNYKNLFIVYKDENSKFFRALADSAVNEKDRFCFNEKFEPKFYKEWIKVLKTKKPLYYKSDIKGLWATYLYPVVKNNRVDYIIVIDFSIKPINMIESNLKTLKKFFVLFIVFIVVTVTVLIFFVVYDYSRQKKMIDLFKEINELNANLQKRVEKEVEKSRQKDRQLILQSRMALMGELLSMIAHQWRQPLNVIGSIVTNMEFDLKFGNIDKNVFEENIEKLKANIKYLSVTIDNFRKFYREDSKKENINIADTVEETVSMIIPSLQQKNINLVKNIECQKKIKTLKNEIKQVILNLIKNAEDAIYENGIKKGIIKINVFEENGKCIIEVEDNAGGVDEKIKDKIFDPYFTTKDEKNGTGLGLYMSKIIVEKKLDSKIYVYNRQNGAVFKIELQEA